MKSIVIFWFVLVNSLNLFSQNITLDTIQSINNKNVFSIKIAKLNESEFEVIFKNISKKDLFFANLQIENQNLYNGDYEKIYFGEGAFKLDDFKYFILSKVKPMEEIKVRYVGVARVLSKIVKFHMHVAFIFKNQCIEKNDGQLLIKKDKLIKKLIKFTYEFDFKSK